MNNKTSHVIVFDDDQRKQVELDAETWETLLSIFNTGECDCAKLPNGNYVFKANGKEIARFERWY